MTIVSSVVDKCCLNCKSKRLLTQSVNLFVYLFIPLCRRFSDPQFTRVILLVIAGKVINVTLVITSENCTDGKPDQAIWGKLREKVTIQALYYVNWGREGQTAVG